MNKVFIFALGATVGSLVTWKIVEEKYKMLADEEIESVVEHFNNRLNELQGETEISEEKEEYKDIASEYTDEVKEEDVVLIPQQKDYINPYVIAPEEFGEFGNTIKTLTYYSDLVLADEDYDIINEPENVIGDALTHFGEYEDDAVYVRDENAEIDYEILKHEKTFSEVYKEER